MSNARPEIKGDIGHDLPETSTSFPVKTGGVAKEMDGTDPGSVAENDRVEFRATRDGRQFVEIGHPYSFEQHLYVSLGSTTNAALIPAPGAGLSLYITDVICEAEVGTTFIFNEATTTARKFRFTCGTVGDTVSHAYRQPKKVTANTALTVTIDNSPSSIWISGYIAP